MHTKVSADQQISAGFDTYGLRPEKIKDWGNDELSKLANRNAINFGTTKWEHENLDIKNIVNFD